MVAVVVKLRIQKLTQVPSGVQYIFAINEGTLSLRLQKVSRDSEGWG